MPIAIGYTVRFYNLKASVIKACKVGNAKNNYRHLPLPTVAYRHLPLPTVAYRHLPLPTVAFSSD